MLDSFPMKEHALVKIGTKEITNKIIMECHFEKIGHFQFNGQFSPKAKILFLEKTMTKCPNDKLVSYEGACPR